MNKIIPLSEGSFTVGSNKKFIPFNPKLDQLNDRVRGSLLVEIQPFLVITPEDILLIDTGLGFKESDGTLQIHRNMLSNGINPMDVTKVLMSHLHKDHAGGLTVEEGSTGQRTMAFPFAQHYISRNEWNYAIAQDGLSYHYSDFNILESMENLTFLDDAGVIDGYIKYETSGGHCPYHMVFKIEGSDGFIFYGGDEASQLSHMKTRFKAKYDFDGEKSMHLRDHYWSEGVKHHWKMLFYHDIKMPIIQLGRTESNLDSQG